MLADSQATGAGYDFRAAIARLDNDVGLFLDMVQFFREDSPELLRQLREGLDAGDVKQVERAAHSLKGLSATFDAAGTVEAARRIEQMGKAQNLTSVPEMLDQLAAEVVRLNKALDEFEQRARH